MTRTIRIFLFVEAVTFAVASLIHAGILIGGYDHHEAHLAEAVIATVLVVGLVLTWLRPSLVRAIGLVAQGFARPDASYSGLAPRQLAALRKPHHIRPSPNGWS
ncbi:MAG: hypothetical protein ACREOG_15415 [Gemmatimonadaceae bacterium]